MTPADVQALELGLGCEMPNANNEINEVGLFSRTIVSDDAADCDLVTLKGSLATDR
jgi:hypothetical protein